jgi:diguanylate cyclase (GGDEF)-like protein/PAS domain S-box-containing protein
MTHDAASRQAPPANDESAKDRRRAALESILVSAVATVALGTGIAGMWITSEDTLRENYQHYLTSLAQAAAQQVDTTLHAGIRDPGQLNGPDYRKAVEPLRRLRAAVNDVEYVYTAVLDGSTVRFVLDAADPGDHDNDGVEDQAGVWEVYEGYDPAILAALGDGTTPGTPEASREPYSDAWGSFISGWAPILDREGHQVGVVGVDVNASVYLARRVDARQWALFGLVPAGLVILGLGMTFYYTRLRGLAAARRATKAAHGAEESARVLAEEQERLRDSESKFRGLFELSPVGISLNDMASGRFLQVNDSLLGPTGYSREELASLTYWDITPVSYASHEAEHIESLKRSGRYGPYEKEFIRKDGTRYPVLLSGMRMTDANNRTVIWSLVQDISQRKALELKLTQAARCDRLTGLANRALFMERLHHAIACVRSGQQALFAVLFLDFDHFKLLNDTLGHDAGDELLKQIAVRLRASLRSTDAMSDDAGGNLIARFGGDEFVILINDLSTTKDAPRVAERLLNALAPVYSVHGREVHSSASIGIVTSEQCMESPEEVIRNADVAMYEAKRSGRACSAVFNEAMHTRLTRHVTIESGLRKALGTAQLSLAYQPIVELSTGRMASAEALLRWNHPVLGNISPSEFIPVAEESGLIIPIGEWVLQEACRQLAEWRRQDPERAPDTVSVNVSRAELALGKKLLQRVQSTLEKTGIPAESLQLEVTEREVMRDPTATRSVMQELRSLGVRLAMDDFGTGASSLSCLRDYPFDTIKIDRSFVSDLAIGSDELAVLHSTIMLVENLGMSSVAEGVEHASHVAVLQSLGCRFAQGYFLSRPVHPDALLAALDKTVLARAAEEPELIS